MEFILDTVGSESKHILEVACGGGRILAPLARAGHIVTGFDSDKAMLERCKLKIKPLSNANCYHADAVVEDWGTYGKYIVVSGDYSANTRIDRSSRRYEITPANGNTEIFEVLSVKHFPPLSQVHSWLSEVGFVIEQEYSGYERQLVNETIIGNRAIIWAREAKS